MYLAIGLSRERLFLAGIIFAVIDRLLVIRRLLGSRALGSWLLAARALKLRPLAARALKLGPLAARALKLGLLVAGALKLRPLVAGALNFRPLEIRVVIVRAVIRAEIPPVVRRRHAEAVRIHHPVPAIDLGMALIEIPVVADAPFNDDNLGNKNLVRRIRGGLYIAATINGAVGWGRKRFDNATG